MKGKKPIRKWAGTRLTEDELANALKTGADGIAVKLKDADFIDVECDTPEAETALLKMFDGAIPPTPTFQSPRGKHRLIRRSDGLQNKAKVELDGVEFRLGQNTNALSVVPPSPGRSWLPGLSPDDVEPVELPAAIADRLRAPQTGNTSATSTEDEKITEGKRNSYLFAKGCALRDSGLPADALLVLVRGLNNHCCSPPLPDEEVHTIVENVLKSEPSSKVFLRAVIEDCEFWHDQKDDPYVTVMQNGHKENLKIGNRKTLYKQWLYKRYYDKVGKPLRSAEFAEMTAVLEGKAIHDGLRHDTHLRVAGSCKVIYLDLADTNRTVIAVDAENWRIVDDPPVRFIRKRAMHSLPDPKRTQGRYLKQLLFPFLNMTEDQWPLVAAWLAAALRPVGPYPILLLFGEQGSAKTTFARVLRALLDPNVAPVRSEPSSPRDLMIAANNGLVFCLDNLSTISSWLSDGLCRLSTGGGYSTRTLFEDEEETIFDVMRPVILTGVDLVINRSDLMERTVIVELPSIREGKRRPEITFWAEFEKARPKILGALLDVVSGSMKHLPEVDRRAGQALSRMADFEQWGTACEGPLGLKPGTFAATYEANRRIGGLTALEGSPVVTALLKYLNTKPTARNFNATSAGWLSTLAQYTDPDVKRTNLWPKTERVLSQIFGRLAPNLRQIGIVATRGTQGTGDAKRKVWFFMRVPTKNVV
jgi:hypothetical protein